VEGVTSGIADIGFPAANMWVREGNWMGNGYCPAERDVTGPKLEQIAGRVGFHLYDFTSGREITDLTFDTLQDLSEVVWKDIPDGTVLKKIGYLAPFNAPDSFLLNIAKFKAHGMGMTLCSKNLQGMTVSPLIRFCEGVEAMRQHPTQVQAHFTADAEQRIDELYARHVTEGYVRWDRPGITAEGGYGMETWAQRTCDSLSVMSPGLHVIEGVYGRNGNGFTLGPGPGGTAEDFMSNVVIFGRNPLLVDIIGTWMSGHEPGNFGFFHIAKERGLIDRVDPRSIPVYSWTNGVPVAASLDELPRTPLVTTYLRKDYNGGTEEQYHLVNEPFDYTTDAGGIPAPVDAELLAGYPNPVRSNAVIEYRLGGRADICLEVLDSNGRRVALLDQGRRGQGAHTVVWHPGRLPSGAYWTRLQGQGRPLIRKIVILR
jgi:uncharacterized protein (DUF362 family)